MRRKQTEEGIRLGRAIRDVRTAQGWSQAYVAQRIGIHAMYLSQIERGYYVPSPVVLLDMESFFHLPPGALVEPPKETPVYHLGDLIRRLRLERDWTQEQLAEKAGITDGAISSHERDVWLPALDTLERIAKAFEVDVALFEPFLLANIPERQAIWTHEVKNGILTGEKATMTFPPPRVNKPLPTDYPDPVWTVFQRLPAQWFPRVRLAESASCEALDARIPPDRGHTS